MAPTEQVAHLLARVYCRDGFYSNGVCRSRWSYWGRWVFTGVVIAIFILVLVCLGCVNSRRRRKRGLNPRYGTGWMAGPPKYSQQNNPGAYAPPPPQYTPGPGPNQYGAQPYGNQGYYGGQQEGIQPPQGAYYPPRSGDNFYEPPPGAPPGK